MSFPLVWLLIPFAVVILFFFIFSFFALYHAIRFGYSTFVNVFVMLLYIGTSVAVLTMIGMYIVSIDWSQTIQIQAFSVEPLETKKTV